MEKEIVRQPISEHFEKSFQNEYISVLIGQRQVGKTEFIKKFLREKEIHEESLLYLNFDKITEIEKIKKHGLKSLIENHFKEEISNFKNKKVIFIDEAQKLPSIFEEIKVIFDDHKHSKEIKFIISGSSVLDLYSKSAESLAGRVNFKRMFGFNLAETKEMHKLPYAKTRFSKVFEPEFEFSDAKKLKKSFHPLSDGAIKELLKQSLLYGTLPDVVKKFQDPAKVDQIIEYLKDYKNTYIEKDIRTLNRVGDIASFSNCFDLACAQAGNLLVKSNFSKELGINFDTVQNYFSILENTFIIDIVRPFTRNIKKRVVKSPKIYVFDNGLLSLAQGFLSVENLEKTGLVGMYFENLILAEIKKHLFNRVPYLDIYFYRTESGSEIDFVLDYKKKIIPVEVKWTDSRSKISTTALEHFIKEQKNCDYGVVIYNGDFEIDEENKIIFFPAEYFAALDESAV